MRLKELIGELQRCGTWARPKVELEQYPTPPDIAAHMLLAAHAEGDLEGRLVADLGCGGGVLGIGAALLGAEHVLGVDVDPGALEAAAENVAEAEVPVDLLQCDVLQLAVRSERCSTRTTASPPPPAAVAAPLPRRFIDSALPTRREWEASLQLDDAARTRLEAEAGQRLTASHGTRDAAGGSRPLTSSGSTAVDAQSTSTPALQRDGSRPPAGADAPRARGGPFDCVLMNPPFGTRVSGVDVAFLRAGLALCAKGGAVYSLHKTSTRAFLQKNAVREWGAAEARVVAELKFTIPKMYKHHKKAALDVAVDFWRLTA